MLVKSPLHDLHLAQQAHFVPFAGWQMPLHYGSQLKEHLAVREKVGMFDVSHMGIVDMQGEDACAFLRHVLANDVKKLSPGKALYSVMLNSKAGVIDDLICYQLTSQHYRLIINASRHKQDLAHLRQAASDFNTLTITPKDEQALIAVQGPKAMATALPLIKKILAIDLASDAKAFSCYHSDRGMVAITGYTGEAGMEIMLAPEQAYDFWQAMLALGVTPCGLGARDTLRLEAGFALYGNEMDEDTSPLAANLGWTIAWQPTNRDFIGREALTALYDKRAELPKLVGVLLESGIPRAGQPLLDDEDQAIGIITSGSFSPTLKKGIALARLTSKAATLKHCQLLIRHKKQPAYITQPRFVAQGKILKQAT